MDFLLQLILTPIVLWFSPKLIGGVYIKDIKAAVITSLLIIGIGFLVGWLITFLLNLLTLGILAAIGLGVLVRIVANSIVIELVDQLLPDFETKGFLPSLWLAVLFAVVWGIVDLILL